jgi:hypothetical protein
VIAFRANKNDFVRKRSGQAKDNLFLANSRKAAARAMRILAKRWFI